MLGRSRLPGTNTHGVCQNGELNDVVNFMNDTENNIEICDLKEMTSEEYAHTKQEVIDWMKKSGHYR